jgi:hypothetical protein
MFCKRDSDGIDWYDYIYNNGSPFAPGSIKVMFHEGLTRAVCRDESMLFPQGATVLEITGDDVADPHNVYAGLVYDEATNTLTAPPRVVPEMITDRQFFQQLAVIGIITEDDALAANAAVIPPPLLAIINAMPADQRFGAKMIVSGAVEFHRDHPMTTAIGAAYGMSPAQIDDFFRAASAL